MMEGSYGIFVQKAKSRTDTARQRRYGGADYCVCKHKAKCLYKYDIENLDWNKMMKISERWKELMEESYTNIQSEEGILKR